MEYVNVSINVKLDECCLQRTEREREKEGWRWRERERERERERGGVPSKQCPQDSQLCEEKKIRTRGIQVTVLSFTLMVRRPVLSLQTQPSLDLQTLTLRKYSCIYFSWILEEVFCSATSATPPPNSLEQSVRNHL